LCVSLPGNAAAWRASARGGDAALCTAFARVDHGAGGEAHSQWRGAPHLGCHLAVRPQRAPPLAAALKGGDEGGECDAVRGAALRRHLLEAALGILPVRT
jgi:hypothetical protein